MEKDTIIKIALTAVLTVYLVHNLSDLPVHMLHQTEISVPVAAPVVGWGTAR